jgi:hypothetical protein
MAATRYKVIGRTTRPKPKHLLGQYDVPVESIELASDIVLMETTKRLLQMVRSESMAEDREAADKNKWRMMNQIDHWLEYARGILRRQYLAKSTDRK